MPDAIAVAIPARRMREIANGTNATLNEIAVKAERDLTFSALPAAPALREHASITIAATIPRMPVHSRGVACSRRKRTEKMTNKAMPPCIITATSEIGASESAAT